jgi:hypothetical protein
LTSSDRVLRRGPDRAPKYCVDLLPAVKKTVRFVPTNLQALRQFATANKMLKSLDKAR